MHSVVELMRERIHEGSAPGARNDPYVLALAVEGGGMRGVAAAGMVLALEQLGMRDAFDRVYGSSAGSMVGAYFISGQAALGASIYIQDLTTRRFISKRRGLTLGRRPVLDLDFLVDEVIEKVKPLDYERVLSSPIELHVLATSLTSGTCIDLSGFSSKEALREAMRASARLPWLSGPPVTIESDPCYDSGLTDSLAYTAALAGGATHVLVLKTRFSGEIPETYSQRAEWLMRRVLRVEPSAIPLVLSRSERYREEASTLARLLENGRDELPQIVVVGLAADDPTISRLSRDRAELEAGARAGIRAVYRVLEQEAPQIYAVLRAY